MSIATLFILLSSCDQSTETPQQVSTPAAEPPAATAPADNAQTATLTTHTEETEYGAKTTIRVTMGGQTHDAATATGMCHAEAGSGEVLQYVSCFEAGLGTNFELRKTSEGISLWTQIVDEGDEEPAPWQKVWSP